MSRGYLFLAAAIVSEVVATSCLKASEGFSRLGPSVVTVVGYLVAFYCLSQVLTSIPTGVAYAIWSGVGIVLVTLVSWIVYRQRLDAAAIVGLALIVAGVIVVNLFSRTVQH
jgi:small multidrug resistance pump